MKFVYAFRAFFGPQFDEHSPRLADWLRSMQTFDLMELYNLYMLCREGDGQREQEDEMATLMSYHHCRETGNHIDGGDTAGWVRASEEVLLLIRTERYRRIGLDPDLMKALFRQ